MTSLKVADFINGAAAPELAPLLAHVSRRVGRKIEPLDILETSSGPSKLEAATLTFRQGSADFGRL
jgi:hypothetical protein